MLKKHVYLQLEFKRIFKAAFRMFAGAAVLAVIVGAVAFCAQSLLYGDSLMEKIRIGIVAGSWNGAETGDAAQAKAAADEAAADAMERRDSSDAGGTAADAAEAERGSGERADGILGKALQFLESMDSVQATCEFVYMDEADARRALESGELSAIMMIPESLVGDIIDGTNTPVQVIFGAGDSLTAAMLQTLTRAGARTLSASQAGIYAVHDLYMEAGLGEYLQNAYDALNSQYLKFALARSRAFDYETVSVTGGLSTDMYYGAMAVAFFTMLTGMGLARALRREGNAVALKLKTAGMPGWRCLLVRFVALWAVYAALLVLLIGGLMIWSGSPVRLALLGILDAAWVAALILVLYALAPTDGAGILLVFAVSVGGMLLSGGFIPTGFMPEGLAAVGEWLPSGLMMAALGGLMEGELLWRPHVLMIFYAAVFVLAGMVIQAARERGRPGDGHTVAAGGENPAPDTGFTRSGAPKAGPPGQGRLARERVAAWLSCCFKRLMKQPVFVIILLVFPAICTVAGQMAGARRQPVNIAVYIEGSGSGFNEAVMEKLLSDDGILHFYICDSEDELRRDVAAMRAECGYIMQADLETRMRLGENKKLVKTIVSPATVSARLVDEVVFSYIFEAYSPEIVVDYLTESDQVDPGPALTAVERRMSDGSTFHFEFNRDAGNTYESRNIFGGMVEGLFAAYIFICGILGTYDSIKDKKRGVYVRLGYPMSVLIPFLPVLMAAAMGGGAAGLGLGILNGGVSAQLIFRLMVYVLLVTVYCGILAGIFKNESAFCMAIPVLTLGCLLSVIFMSDAGGLFPGAQLMARLFPPAWF